jgi:hypothetical protein
MLVTTTIHGNAADHKIRKAEALRPLGVEPRTSGLRVSASLRLGGGKGTTPHPGPAAATGMGTLSMTAYPNAGGGDAGPHLSPEG